MTELTRNELARPMNATSYTEDIFVSSWCASWQKHCFDVALAVVLLVLSLPVQLVICAVLRFFYRVPVFFRQVRTGRNGRPFVIYKYRTMEERQDCRCSLVTRADDPRITRLGGVLRRTKLDELPQLINILRGEMSFVGPRPRVPTQESSLFMTRPGLTGIASLILAHEEKILQQVPEDAQEQYHAQVLNPLKLRYDLQYVETASLSLDIEIMVRTAIKVYFSPLKAEIDLQSVPPQNDGETSHTVTSGYSRCIRDCSVSASQEHNPETVCTACLSPCSCSNGTKTSRDDGFSTYS